MLFVYCVKRIGSPESALIDRAQTSAPTHPSPSSPLLQVPVVWEEEVMVWALLLKRPHQILFVFSFLIAPPIVLQIEKHRFHARALFSHFDTMRYVARRMEIDGRTLLPLLLPSLDVLLKVVIVVLEVVRVVIFGRLKIS